MTFEKLAEGLNLIILGLANGRDLADPPDDWEPHEWAYVKGIASYAVVQLRENLVRTAIPPR